MKTLLSTHLVLLLFIIPNFGWAQFVTVSGYVKSNIDGKALGNASVFESNSGIGTITGENGYYKLVLEKGMYKLNFTDLGFEKFTQELKLSSDTTLMVTLVPDVDVKHRQKKNDQLGDKTVQEEQAENVSKQ
jgi:hypothetical protein